MKYFCRKKPLNLQVYLTEWKPVEDFRGKDNEDEKQNI